MYNYLNQKKSTHVHKPLFSNRQLKNNICIFIVNKAPQTGISIKIQPQKNTHHKKIDFGTTVTYILEEFSGKQITRHKSNIFHFTLKPKELYVQEQMEKYFSDNSQP